jgi:5'-nucleotidase/UDP-sugar diphosphatase
MHLSSSPGGRPVNGRLAGVALGAVLLFSLAALPVTAAQEQVVITILHTNDLHAMMIPFEEEGQMVGGFSRISTLINQVRRETEPVLLVDAGDALVEDQHLEGNYFRGEPVIKFMNQMGYDLAVPGNHDFEFGLKVLAQRAGEARFPYLAANIVPVADAKQEALEATALLKPYIVSSAAGVRVGFLGLTQPLHDFPGIEIRDTVQVSAELVPRIRQEADLVVVVTHQDQARDFEIVDRVLGIDLLLAAHEHANVYEHGLQRGETLIAKTSAWGREVGRVKLTLARGVAGWELEEAAASLMPVTAAVEEDPEVNRLLEPYLNQADRYRSWLIPILVVIVLGICMLLVLLMRRALKEV